MATATVTLPAASGSDPAGLADMRLAQTDMRPEAPPAQTDRRTSGRPSGVAAAGRIAAAALGSLGLLALLLALSLRRFDRDYRKTPSVTRRSRAGTDHGIPFCHYERTAKGFVVSYRRQPEPLGLLDSRIAAGRAGVFLSLLRLPSLMGALLWAAWFEKPTRIEVTRTVVVIGGERYPRGDFRGFGKQELPRAAMGDTQGHAARHCTLAFFYGTANLKLPGLWQNDHRVDEFLAALNQQLQAVPRAA
jgi:hypothetical protein